jgi:hypothetical protein
VNEQTVPGQDGTGSSSWPGRPPSGPGTGTARSPRRLAMTRRLMPRRVPPVISAGVYPTPAETPAYGRLTPQVSGEIDLAGADPAHG